MAETPPPAKMRHESRREKTREEAKCRGRGANGGGRGGRLTGRGGTAAQAFTTPPPPGCPPPINAPLSSPHRSAEVLPANPSSLLIAALRPLLGEASSAPCWEGGGGLSALWRWGGAVLIDRSGDPCWRIQLTGRTGGALCLPLVAALLQEVFVLWQHRKTQLCLVHVCH